MGGGAAASRVSSAMAVAAAALVVMWAGTAAAAVYEVGDKTGWTIMGNPNYTAWAASKKFHLGDTVDESVTKKNGKEKASVKTRSL
uniref:Phytocyanin domain-containing protein n=1 Tax=Oryza barthii TaxID=65489 RepID=A0A0D3GSL3_9ORYZ